MQINTDRIDEEEFDELYEDDLWEDPGYKKWIDATYPGWYVVKMPGFTSKRFEEVKQWLTDGNVNFGRYATVGWSSGCAYSVGVVFESGRDAVFFKLRWR